MTYTTMLGDTWDSIAKKLYGSEYKAELLMDNNRDKLSELVFDDGVELYVPEEVEEKRNSALPSWRV